MTTFLSEQEAIRAGLITGKKKKAPAKEARPEIPRAAAGEGDRIAQLMRIAVYGYGPRFDAGLFSFWKPATGQRTTAHAEYAQACIAAEKELRP